MKTPKHTKNPKSASEHAQLAAYADVTQGANAQPVAWRLEYLHTVMWWALNIIRGNHGDELTQRFVDDLQDMLDEPPAVVIGKYH